MNKEIISITTQVQRLPLVTWKGVPVITTEVLAELYTVSEQQLRQNHCNNKGRFFEAKHYYKLTGSDLREFKEYIKNFDLLNTSSKAPSLVLWTERGAVRHAKMLGSDKAWEVQEILEDSYFKRVEHNNNFTIPTTLSSALQLAADQARQLEEQTRELAEAKPKLEYMDKYVQSNNSKAIREAAKILGIKERTFTGFLKSKKIVYVQGGALLPYQQYIDKGYFEVRTGHKYGHCWHQARVTAEGLQWISNIARVE